MDKWEYMEFNCAKNGMEKLNELGQQGWEVVCCTGAPARLWILLLKRKVQS